MIIRAIFISILLVVAVMLLAKATKKQWFLVLKVLGALTAVGVIAYALILTIYNTTQGSIL